MKKAEVAGRMQVRMSEPPLLAHDVFDAAEAPEKPSLSMTPSGL